MDGLYRSIELPDPTNYGLTSELKPEQKAEASIDGWSFLQGL